MIKNGIVDIIMATWNRLEYTKKALPALLNQTYPIRHIYLTDNASTQDTIDYLKKISLENPDKIILTLEKENRGLAAVTNDFWQKSDAEYVGRVDNDTIVPSNWLEKLMDAHSKCDKFGVLAGFHFLESDVPNDIKINELNGVQFIRQMHVGGCSFIIRKDLVDKCGLVDGKNGKLFGWTEYQHQLHYLGYVNAYLYPFIFVDHMADGRSDNCIKNEWYETYEKNTRGLSVDEYTEHFLKEDAARLLRQKL